MNRDEKWDRAAEGIHIWPGEARVVAGKDLEKGGTWLGINRHGRIRVVVGKSHTLFYTTDAARILCGIDEP